jgi:hypothetical protein
VAKTKKKPKKKTGDVRLKVTVNPVILLPPPVALKACPRCGKPHKKFKARKFTKPMEFFGLVAMKPVVVARSSYWLLCPKLKEPIIFYDQYITAQNVEDFVAKSMADEVAAQIDKEVLSDLQSFAASTKKRKGKPEEIRVRFKGGKAQKWVVEDKPKVKKR